MKYVRMISRDLRQVLAFLDGDARRKLFRITLFQSFFAVLDLAAVVLIGVIGSMAVLGIQSKESKFGLILSFLGIENFTFQQQIALLSVVASVLLISKTTLSAFVVWRTTRYYSYLAVSISGELINKFLKQPINSITASSTQQNLYGLVSGVNSLVVGVVANLSSLVSDFVLIVLMTVTLFVTDPVMAILAIAIFGSVALLLHVTVGMKSRRIAEELIPRSIDLNEALLSTLEGYRELFVSNRLKSRQVRISDSMRAMARLSFRQSFLPYVSKFMIEIVLVFSIIIFSAVQFLFKDVVGSASTLGLFLAASSRIAPAALRIQQGVSGVMNGVGGGKATIEMKKELDDFINRNQELLKIATNNKSRNIGKAPAVKFTDVTFSYKKNTKLLSGLTFSIEQGERVLLLGQSGEGKSSLVDLMLGLLVPNSGEIALLGSSPRSLIENCPHCVSYMPQQPYLFRGTIRENITDGAEDVSDLRIWKALEAVQMKEYVEKLPGKLDGLVAENGKNFSGGQRQRLNLARTLFMDSRLLILDEATSALDAITEAKIINQILLNRKIKTLILIAHKFENVTIFDKVGVLREGNISFVKSKNQTRSPRNELEHKI